MKTLSVLNFFIDVFFSSFFPIYNTLYTTFDYTPKTKKRKPKEHYFSTRKYLVILAFFAGTIHTILKIIFASQIEQMDLQITIAKRMPSANLRPSFEATQKRFQHLDF